MATAGAESRRKPEEIERDLERTRAEMDDTIRAIEEKVAPGEWLDQALEYFAESSLESVRFLSRGIKRNPLPLALVGIGISWLVLAGGREPQPAEVRERSSYPFAMGALVFSIGAAVGAILPATRGEARLMGKKREQAFEKMEEMAREQLERAKESAREAGRAVKAEVRRRFEGGGTTEEPSREKEPAM